MAIREDIKDLILQKESLAQQAQKENSDNILKFENFNKKETITANILRDILKKRQKVNFRGEDIDVFYSDEKDKLTGYLSDIYGCTAILSLVDVENPGGMISEEVADSLVKNVAYIVKEIKDKGFTLFPYLSNEDNVFNEKGDTLFNRNYPYIGAMTWAISFLTSVRKARIHEVTDVDTNEKKMIGYLNIDKDLLADINNLIVRIVRHFNEAVIFIEDKDAPDGLKYLGWSYTTNCAEPSLFFTYSVLEAYSDFEDNVFDVETNPDGSYRIEQGTLFRNYKEDSQDLREAFKKEAGDKETQIYRWTKAVERVAQNVWDVYKGVLSKEFVSDQFLHGFDIIKTEDMVKMDHTNALFNNVYLVCILLYGWTNVLNKEESEEIVATMESALQNVQRVNDSFTRKGLDYLISTYTVPFINAHKDRGNTYIKRLNYRRMSDTTLLPILIKANNLIAFYITKYPVKKMDTLFKDIFDNDNICDEEFLWDDKGYDVKITERYIEAINQFYEYYESYEQDYNNKFKRQYSTAYGKGRAAGKEEQKELNRAAIENAELEANRRIEEEKSKFVIENAINARIAEMVNASLSSYLDNIARKLNGEDITLNENEEKVLASLDAMVKGYIVSFINKILPDSDEFNNILDNMNADLRGAILKWSEELQAGKKPLLEIMNAKRSD